MKKLVSFLSKISIPFWISVFLFTVAFFAFASIADENILENNYHFDTAVINFIKGNSTPLLYKIMLFVTFFGSSKFLLPAYIFLVIFLGWKHKKAIALDVSIIAISSTSLMFLLKDYFHRHRPNSILGNTLLSYSFPSGHSVSSFVFCSILAYLVWQTRISDFKKYSITFLLLLYTLAVGLSRIILLVHYATDVIAGYCFAVAWLLFSFWMLKLIRERYFKKADIKNYSKN